MNAVEKDAKVLIYVIYDKWHSLFPNDLLYCVMTEFAIIEGFKILDRLEYDNDQKKTLIGPDRSKEASGMSYEF